nr:PGF-CTERM-anchored ABC transporter substrate-binding protein [Halorubrum persicum]
MKVLRPSVQNSRAILLAVLVVTALVGAPGTAAGAESVGAELEQSTDNAPSTDADGHEPLQTASSGTCDFPLNVTDATGTNISLNERPDRITTTNPSAAQTLWEIGAQDRVVGVTQYAGYLNGTDNKTNVSAGFGVSVEKVVATEPDLVLAPNASAGQVDDLRAQNLTVYHFSEATDVDDIAAKTERTGRLVGNCDEAAEVNDEMNETVANVTNQTADFDRLGALYPLGGGYVAANNTFINEMMDIGGTINVAASEGDGYPQLSDEVILETDPELILVTDSEAAILDREPYASTTAGSQGNYVVMNEDYLNQPAPRSVIESTKSLATAVEKLQTESNGEEATDGGNTCGFPLNVTDATGTNITLNERPDRITTTNPSAAQTLWEIGARDRVVGVTQFAGYLNGTDNKTNVSSEGFGVSVERVVATEPDLVLVPNASSAGTAETLRGQNLTVYHFSEATDVDDIAAKTERTGRLVGNCDEAANINDEMNDTVADVENRTSDLRRPAALYPLGGGYVAADETFINEIMHIGGTNNVAATEGSGYPVLSDEVVLRTDPELIIVTESNPSILDQEPYASTSAGVHNNYVVLDNNYLNQPAPRSVIESVETLATGVEELQSESGTGSRGSDSSSSSSGSDDSSSSSSGSDDSDGENKEQSEGNETATDGNETAVDTPTGENTTAVDSDEESDEAGGSDDTADQGDEQDGVSADTTDDETESETPGFGFVVTALAILGFAYVPLRN